MITMPEFQPSRSAFTAAPYDYITRFTHTYQEHHDDPIAIREAYCLDVIARCLYLPFEPGDLLAGRVRIAEVGFSSEPLLGRSVAYYYDAQRFEAAMNDPALTKGQREELAAMLEYWKQEETRRNIRAAFPEYMKQALPEDIYWEHSQVAFPLYRVIGLYMDFEKLLRLGLNGLKAEALARREIAAKKGEDETLFTGMAMALDSLKGLCLRYAALAAKEAEQAGEEERRGDLYVLADALHAITEREPQSFVEALQLVWLYIMVSGCLNYGRMDDYLGDFLAADLQMGRITEEKALAYLQSLWRILAARNTVFHGRVVIGGKGRRHEANADCVALLAIEASRTVEEIEPQLSLRFYEGQNPELMEKALDCIGQGRTYPMLYNDDVNIPAMRDAMEVTEKEAEDYLMLGCGEYMLNHRSFASPNGLINLLKTLEVTLSNGRDLVDGKELGLKLGGLQQYATFEELYDAYLKEFTYYVEILAQQEELEYAICAKTAPFLYMTMLFDDCMERGRAIFNGGIHYLGGTLETYGNVNTINSLYAIQKLVYEEKSVAPDELLNAMKEDFKGYEILQRRLLAVEKYGNDLPGVDAFAQRFHRDVCTIVRRQRERTSLYSYLIVIINNEANTVLGRFTAASPDGRNAREPMANGNNPTGGTDRRGLTAMLNSLTKLDTHLHAGSVQNMKFSPELFNGHRNVVKAALQTYWENGGAQAMITVVGREDLEQAMVHPERYSNLMVRVGGFSARFVTLSPDVQREIASRTCY